MASGKCLCNCNWIVWNEIQKLNKLFTKVDLECGFTSTIDNGMEGNVIVKFVFSFLYATYNKVE